LGYSKVKIFNKKIFLKYILAFRQELIIRINESKKLNDEYQAYFHKTKGKLRESANERQWNFRYKVNDEIFSM